MNRLMLSVAAAIVSATIGAQAEVQKKDVNIQAPDGVILKGTYFSPGNLGPGMLLLHQCDMDQRAWDGLASDLANAGLHVLTFDFRSFGETGGDDAAREKWPGDVDAAYAHLLSQDGVDRTRVAVGGASCGVAQSADLATRRPEIKTLLLLSSSRAAAAKDHIANTPALAVFGAASEGDEGSAAGIREALEASKHPRSVLKIYPGTEHGVPMFEKNSELRPAIVNWLTTQLAVRAGTD